MKMRMKKLTGYSTIIVFTIVAIIAVVRFHSVALQGSLYQGNHASCGNSSKVVIPSTITAGVSFPISVYFQNDGSTTWNTSNYHMGPYKGPPEYDDTSLAVSRQSLTASVVPGGTAIFTFQARVMYAGSKTVQFAMLQDNVQWFGNCTVTLSAANPPPPSPQPAPIKPPVSSSSSKSSVPVPSADVSVALSTPKYANQYPTLQYSLIITNTGPYDATVITASYPLPNSSVYPVKNIESFPGCSMQTSRDYNWYQCLNIAIPKGTTKIFTVNFSPTSDKRLACNTVISTKASVTSNISDPNLINNQSTLATTTVKCQ